MTPAALGMRKLCEPGRSGASCEWLRRAVILGKPRHPIGDLPMLRFLSIAAAGTGVAAALAIACSGSLEPTTGVFQTPGQASTPEQAPSNGPTLTPQVSGTSQRLQAVSPVNDKVVWASGLGGTFAITTNGGNTWLSRVVPGAEELQFRDVHGVSEKVAYLLSAGEGSDNRIYKTKDGGPPGPCSSRLVPIPETSTIASTSGAQTGASPSPTRWTVSSR